MNTRARAERRLAWWLCAPAVAVMLVVTAFPIAYALWLSLFRYDLRFPGDRHFVGLSNYASVLGSEVWWQALANTLIITASSVAVELVLGFALAALMHRVMFGRSIVRASILVPFPQATDDHQRANAQTIEAAGAAVMIEEKDLTGERLAAEIRALLTDDERRQAMALKARGLARPDAAEVIATRAEALLERTGER